MRILMVVRPAVGGMKRQVLDLSSGLVAEGHHVDVAAPAGSDVADSARALGLQVFELPLIGALNPVTDSRTIRELTRIVRQGGYDVVHAHGFKAGLVARFSARSGGAGACVITVHNPVLTRTDTPALARYAYRTLERTFAGRVDHYLAASHYISRELTEDFGLPAEKVTVVYGSVNAEPFLEPRDGRGARLALGIEPDARVVGFSARLSDQKGVETLLAAAPRLIASDPALRILIGGTGPREAAAHALAEQLGIAEKVVWAGWVTDMPALLAAIDVFVSPALTEAFGLALLEVGAAGVPVVATAVGGVPEVVLADETGLLIAPHDPDALASAVLTLLADPALAQQLSSSARSRVLAEFSLERTVEGTLAVYDVAREARSRHNR